MGKFTSWGHGSKDISDKELKAMIQEIDNAMPFFEKYDCGSVRRAALLDKATLIQIQRGRKLFK